MSSGTPVEGCSAMLTALADWFAMRFVLICRVKLRVGLRVGVGPDRQAQGRLEAEASS